MINIIKLGGSVISNKDEVFSFNEEIVKNIADEIGNFYPSEKFVIVHGGGSFGHPLAKKYGIKEGFEGEYEKLMGFCHTHRAMMELNQKIIDVFLSSNLPAFSISPSSIFITYNGDIKYGNIDSLKTSVDMNLIPVLFGDVVMDVKKGMDIISGDNIISYLAKKMDVKKVIFLMDVDGIYDRHPHNKNARLIKELREEMKIKSEIKKFDVTGGIENKIKEAFKMDCTVYFINGRKKGNLSMAIRGEKVGTIKKGENIS